MAISTVPISRDATVAIVVPIVVVVVAVIGLFYQQTSFMATFQSNYLSLREHAEYEASTRRELDAAKTAADSQINALQRQLDVITTQIRLQLEGQIQGLQSQVDQLHKTVEEQRVGRTK